MQMVELLTQEPAGRTVLFAHPMYVTHLEDGSLPAQTLLAPAHKAFDRENYLEDLQMSGPKFDGRRRFGGVFRRGAQRLGIMSPFIRRPSSRRCIRAS